VVPGREARWEAISKPSPAQGAICTSSLCAGIGREWLFDTEVEAVEDCHGGVEGGLY
jgi:hypothetical protein